ncbi:MAG: permease [Pseudomonadota bacterium]
MTTLVLERAGLALARLRRADVVWLLVLLIPLVVWALDPVQVDSVLSFALSAFLGTLPYIAIAVGLIGYLRASGAEGVLADAFQGRETRMIVVAALVGGLAPFCSCEVIPFVAALLAAGAPLAAVMAFWLSSPLMDPPQFFITAGALGFEFAIAKTIFAVVLGLGGGFVVKALVQSGAFANPLRAQKSCGSCCGTGKAMRQRPVWKFWEEAPRRQAFAEAAGENALFLTKWLSLAYLLEALLVHYVPASMIASVVGGDGVMPVVIGALVGAPAYLNGYAAPPLIAGLMETGMSAGAAMAFMLAGAVSSVPAMAAVFALVRREVFATYLMLGIGGAILCGLVFGWVMG